MKKIAIAALLILTALGRPVVAAEVTAQEMIAAADRVRNPGQPFRLTNTLVEYVDGKPRNRMVLVVFAKEDAQTLQFSNLVRYREPPRDEGKLVLMDGTRMWFYDPASKASVRLSPQQRLIGQASNGDVVTANLAKDYRGTLVGEETLQDAERKSRQCWHLDLAAANDEAIYSRIEYWLEKGTAYPVKAKFYSDSGRLLKIVYFRKYEEHLGGIRPTETVIIDAVDPAQVTTMTLADWQFQDIPESWFQRDFLPHLKVE